jgi:hypothetical protein
MRSTSSINDAKPSDYVILEREGRQTFFAATIRQPRHSPSQITELKAGVRARVADTLCDSPAGAKRCQRDPNWPTRVAALADQAMQYVWPSGENLTVGQVRSIGWVAVNMADDAELLAALDQSDEAARQILARRLENEPAYRLVGLPPRKEATCNSICMRVHCDWRAASMAKWAAGGALGGAALGALAVGAGVVASPLAAPALVGAAGAGALGLYRKSHLPSQGTPLFGDLRVLLAAARESNNEDSLRAEMQSPRKLLDPWDVESQLHGVLAGAHPDGKAGVLAIHDMWHSIATDFNCALAAVGVCEWVIQNVPEEEERKWKVIALFLLNVHPTVLQGHVFLSKEQLDRLVRAFKLIAMFVTAKEADLRQRRLDLERTFAALLRAHEEGSKYPLLTRMAVGFDVLRLNTNRAFRFLLNIDSQYEGDDGRPLADVIEEFERSRLQELPDEMLDEADFGAPGAGAAARALTQQGCASEREDMRALAFHVDGADEGDNSDDDAAHGAGSSSLQPVNANQARTRRRRADKKSARPATRIQQTATAASSGHAAGFHQPNLKLGGRKKHHQGDGPLFAPGVTRGQRYNHQLAVNAQRELNEGKRGRPGDPTSVFIHRGGRLPSS